jgi:hypothetical protein
MKFPSNPPFSHGFSMFFQAQGDDLGARWPGFLGLVDGFFDPIEPINRES